MKKSVYKEVDSEIQFQEIIENLKEKLVPLHGQIVNIGAGGMCLAAPQETEFKEDELDLTYMSVFCPMQRA